MEASAKARGRTHLVEPDAAGGEKGVGEGGEGGGGRHRGGEAAAAVDAQHVLHGEWRRRRHLAGGQLDSARGCGGPWGFWSGLVTDSVRWLCSALLSFSFGFSIRR